MQLLTLLLLSSAYAAEGISLADALAGAIQGNADLRAAQASVDAASADVLTAEGAFDPSLGASAGTARSESRSFLAGYPTSSSTSAWSADADLSGELPTGTSWSLSTEIARQSSDTETSLGGVSSEQETDYWASSVGVTVRQDLLAVLRPTDAREAVRRASERADQDEMAALEARQTALAGVADAWWSWKTATERAALAERSVESALALERVTEVWVEEGQAEALELARVRTERLATEQEAAETKAAAVTAGDALLIAMGRDPGADIAPQGEGAPHAPASRDVREHLATASSQSPAISRLDLQLAAARAATRDVRYDGLPSLALTGSAGVTSLDTSASGALRDLAGDDAMPTWAAGLEMSVPLGGRAARGSRQKGGADVRSAEIALDAAERALEADVRAALRDVETAERTLTLATERLEVSRQAEAGERARTEEGLRRTDQLLDAVNAREQAEQDVLDARLDAWRATVQVARLEGGVDAVLAQ
ncbi:MAG: TolC family protein [Pseudomonadota bacterium]|nr:TolC family protein [Pseudomonadota bacterium]